MTKVTFYKIQENAAKLRFICHRAEEAYEWEKKLLIYVPNQEAGHYIDALLWKYSETSFLPHKFLNQSSIEWIVITDNPQNHNQAHRLLNLSNQAFPIHFPFEEIDELMDETHPDKRAAAQSKWEVYQTKGLNPVLVSF